MKKTMVLVLMLFAAAAQAVEVIDPSAVAEICRAHDALFVLDAIQGLPMGAENKIGVHFTRDVFDPGD